MREHRPVIALDFPSFEAVKEFLALFPAEESLYLKVGMELYYAAGPEIVSYLKGLGHSVFLDLKLHDIPNTVKSAMKVLSQLGVDMTNVHAAGGVEMMKAAREGLGSQAKLIAVTQLTSTSEAQMQEFQNIQTSLQESVIYYAKKTAEAGLDGGWCCLLGSGSTSHQAGYQSRFYLSDTRDSSSWCCSWRSKTSHDTC
ncbi:orotidine-5-phosphate decarboxylase [Streptococcus pneumoniae]|nr:orotidine-5-phosphate decarboxylase [Streptococcus pneumoniae]